MSIKVQHLINTKLNSVQDQLNFVAPMLPPASVKKRKKIILQSSTYPSKTPTTSIQVDHPLFPQTARLIHSICQSVITSTKDLDLLSAISSLRLCWIFISFFPQLNAIISAMCASVFSLVFSFSDPIPFFFHGGKKNQLEMNIIQN